MQRFFLITICLANFFILSGCFGVPATHYYTFQPTLVESPQHTKQTSYPFGLSVESYDGDAPYQQDRIVYRTSAYEVNFYEYRRWLRPPTELVTGETLKQLNASRLFSSVREGTFEAATRFVLEGQVLMFDQWYTESKRSTVRVGIRYRLSDPALEQDVLWDETIETAAPTPTMETLEVVKAFELALHENILQAIAAIDRVVTQHTE